MKIKEIQPRQGNITLIATVSEMGDVRDFEKFGKSGRVCTATLKDETGTCNLSLWNEQVDQLKQGDKVQLTNCYANEWQGKVQLTAGKFGKFEVVGSADSSTDGGEVSADEGALTDDELTEEKLLDEPVKEDHMEHILTGDEKLEEELLSEPKKKDTGEHILTGDEMSEDDNIEEEVIDEED